MRLAAAALVRRGAEVRVDPRGENLVRRPREEDRSTANAIVEVQGLGNLFHELVHVVRAGVLDDDHGIDYGQMPFRLESAAHRRLLWDELAACVVSCAYACPDAPDAWFAEQVETQPVFYGMESDPGAFARAVDALAGASGTRAVELEQVVGAAFAEVEAWLREAGASEREARPARNLRFSDLWASYARVRADWFADANTGPERQTRNARRMRPIASD
jgi:hypothetical protein